MTLFDILLVCIIVGFVVSGLSFGFIHTLGSLIGMIVGVFVAGHYYTFAAEKALGFFAGNLLVANIIAFIVLFIVASNVVGFVFWILNKTFHLFTFVPFLKTINRLAGALLGLAQSVIGLGLILYFSQQIIPASFGWYHAAVETSQVAAFLLSYGKILVPLLPAALKEIREAEKLLPAW